MTGVAVLLAGIAAVVLAWPGVRSWVPAVGHAPGRWRRWCPTCDVTWSSARSRACPVCGSSESVPTVRVESVI